MSKCGRRPVLDAAKKREILAIVAVGCSRTVAAAYVGCAISTIQNTADRDPTFAEKLRQAACATELGLLKNIRNAAAKEQYWRAAAWALERRFPERYARRGPDVITLEQVAALLGPVQRHRGRGSAGPLPQAGAEAAGETGPQPGRSHRRGCR